MVTTTPISGMSEKIERFVEHFRTHAATSEFETRRTAPRFLMAEPVDVMIDSDETPADVILASGRDISSNGIGIYANKPIRAGTEMIVSIESGTDRLLAKAVAVHSTMSVGLYKVGARFIV